MKKLLIIASLLIIVGTATVFILMYMGSFQKVSITFDKSTTGGTLYLAKEETDHDAPQGAGTEIEKLTSDKIVSLQKGNYYIKPTGNNTKQDEIHFTVNDQPLTVEVNPGYNDEYLSHQLTLEQAAITKAMFDAFPLIKTSYTTAQARLYQKGEWYGALLKRTVEDPRDQRDYYRIILYKESGTWKVVNKPELLLFTSDFKDVPIDILKAVNKLTL